MFISNILEQIAGEIELAAGEVQLAWMNAWNDDSPAKPSGNTRAFSITNILNSIKSKDSYLDEREAILVSEYSDSNTRLKFYSNYHCGLLVILEVAGLIKGLTPEGGGKRYISEPSKFTNAEKALLGFISTTERFTDPVYSKAKPAPIIEYTNPLNNHGVYFDDEMIEYIFETIKAEDPAKECRVKSDIKAGKATIEYLIPDTQAMQEAAATSEADDVEIIYANQEDAGAGEANRIENRRKNWKEMRDKLREEN